MARSGPSSLEKPNIPFSGMSWPNKSEPAHYHQHACPQKCEVQELGKVSLQDGFIGFGRAPKGTGSDGFRVTGAANSGRKDISGLPVPQNWQPTRCLLAKAQGLRIRDGAPAPGAQGSEGRGNKLSGEVYDSIKRKTPNMDSLAITSA